MKIRLIFDIAKYMIYVPDGYIIDTKQLQRDFLNGAKRRKKRFQLLPGRDFAGAIQRNCFSDISMRLFSEKAERKHILLIIRKITKKSCLKFSFSTVDGSVAQGTVAQGRFCVLTAQASYAAINSERQGNHNHTAHRLSGISFNVVRKFQSHTEPSPVTSCKL